MFVGHNPMCVSTLALAALGSSGHFKSPLCGLAISVMPGFQIAFPCIIPRPNFFDVFKNKKMLKTSLNLMVSFKTSVDH